MSDHCTRAEGDRTDAALVSAKARRLLVYGSAPLLPESGAYLSGIAIESRNASARQHRHYGCREPAFQLAMDAAADRFSVQSQQEYLADMRDQLRRKEDMMEVNHDVHHADQAYASRAQRIQANHTATLQVHSGERPEKRALC